MTVGSIRFSMAGYFLCFRFMLTQEVAKFQLADLFSKVGGILNLWAGITVVLILELVEFVMRFLLHSCKKNKTDAQDCEEGKKDEKPVAPSRDDVKLHSMRDKEKYWTNSNRKIASKLPVAW